MFDMWGCNVLVASKKAHVSNKSYYNWRIADPEFAAKVKDIKERHTAELQGLR